MIRWALTLLAASTRGRRPLQTSSNWPATATQAGGAAQSRQTRTFRGAKAGRAPPSQKTETQFGDGKSGTEAGTDENETDTPSTLLPSDCSTRTRFAVHESTNSSPSTCPDETKGAEGEERPPRANRRPKVETIRRVDSELTLRTVSDAQEDETKDEGTNQTRKPRTAATKTHGKGADTQGTQLTKQTKGKGKRHTTKGGTNHTKNTRTRRTKVTGGTQTQGAASAARSSRFTDMSEVNNSRVSKSYNGRRGRPDWPKT